MKPIHLLQFFVYTFVLLSASARIAATEQQSDLALICGRDSPFAESADYALLGVELSRHARVRLVERAQLERILAEIDLQLLQSAGGVRERRALGQLLKAQLLLIIQAREIDAGADTEAGANAGAGAKQKILEVQLVDTQRGLRIAQDTLLWPEQQPEQTVKLILALLERGMNKLDESLAAIVAVPPFLSDDLTYHYNFLKQAYARIAANQLQFVPGLLLVEYDEARAIAAEMQLTGPERISRELLPLILQGKYRNSGEDKERKLSLSLELLRGDEVLGARQMANLAPDAADAFICENVLNLLVAALKLPPQHPDPAREYAQLLERSADFGRLSYYAEALELAYAASLLNPNPGVWEKCIRLGIRYIDQLSKNIYYSATYAERFEAIFGTNLLCLELLEKYMRSAAFFDNPEESWKLCSNFIQSWNDVPQHVRRAINANTGNSRTYQRFSEELVLRKREVVFDILDALAAQKQLNENTLKGFLWHIAFPNSGVSIREPEQDRQQVIYHLLRILNAADDPYNMVEEIMKQETRPIYVKMDRLLNYLAALPGLKNQIYAAYYLILMSELSDEEKYRELQTLRADIAQSGIYEKYPNLLTKPPAAEFDLFSKLNTPADDQIQTEKSAQNSSPTFGLEPVLNYLPCLSEIIVSDPKERDVLSRGLRHPKVSGDKPYIYDEKQDKLNWDKARILYDDPSLVRHYHPLGLPGNKYDRLQLPDRRLAICLARNIILLDENCNVEPVYKLEWRSKDEYQDIVFDGKFIWGISQKAVIAYELQSAKTYVLEQDRGFPPGNMRAAAFEPGRICLAGGLGRGWIAELRIANTDKIEFEIFHEAKLTDADVLDAQLAFVPLGLYTFGQTDDNPSTKVLLVRDSSSYPLIIDSTTLQVSVLATPISALQIPQSVDGVRIMHDNRLYSLEPAPDATVPYYGGNFILTCISPPSFGRETLIDEFEFDFVTMKTKHYRNGKIILVDGNLFVFSIGILWRVDIGSRTGRYVANAWSKNRTELIGDRGYFDASLNYKMTQYDPDRKAAEVFLFSPKTVQISQRESLYQKFKEEIDKTAKSAATGINADPNDLSQAPAANCWIEKVIESAKSIPPNAEKIDFGPPEQVNARTISGKYQITEYFHKFYIKELDGQLNQNFNSANLPIRLSRHVGKAQQRYSVHITWDEVRNGGYFPTGTLSANYHSAAGKNMNFKYELSPGSPEVIIFDVAAIKN